MTTSGEPLRLALRTLWSDHVIWTRGYIVAAVAGTPDADSAAGRLLRNQEDIGAAVAGFYGQAAGDRLTELLKEHILIAVDLVAAAKSGDQASFATHDQRWTANIETIAAFLAGANPNWPEKDVLDLLALHLKLTKDETVARISGDWAADVKAFDEIFTEIMVARGRPQRRHRRPVPRALRDGGGDGMTSTASPLAAPALPALEVGAAAPSFEELLGTDGRRYGLASFAACDLVVLVFSSNRCPTARAYAERMNALQTDEGSRGVQLVAINSNDPHLYPDESYPRMIERAAEDRYTFPYLVDAGQHVARAFGADLHVPCLPARSRAARALPGPLRRFSAAGARDDARSPERHRGPARRTRGRGPDHASVRLQPRSGVR